MSDGAIEARLRGVEQLTVAMSERLKVVERNTEKIIEHVQETNGRVSVLERGQFMAMGAIGVIVFLMGAFGVYALTVLD